MRERGLHFVGARHIGARRAPERPVDHARRARGALRVPGAAAGRNRSTRRRRAVLHHIGPDGAGHFVKMVHNGIEYSVCS